MDDTTTTQQALHFLIDDGGRICTAGWPMTLCCKPWEIVPEKAHYNSPQLMSFISTVALQADGRWWLHWSGTFTYLGRADINVTFSVWIDAIICFSLLDIALLTLLHSLPYNASRLCLLLQTAQHFLTCTSNSTKWADSIFLQSQYVPSTINVSLMLSCVYVQYFKIKHLPFLVK